MTCPQTDIFFVGSRWDSIPDAHCFSHNAMATVFEIIIVHGDDRYAQQAATAAFGELDKIEQQLSRFVENSDICRINNLPANLPLQLGLETFECLQLCICLSNQTGGAFDVTVGSLMECWLNEDKTLRLPCVEGLEQARQHTGMHLVKLDETKHTVELLTSPIRIDLGGIGKGYAVDRMAELLRDWSIDTALINGGCSSVLALGSPGNTKGWHLTLSNPANHKQILTNLYLKDRAVSGSGLLKGPHTINPITGQPVKGKTNAWACAPTAATADALSTAFMVMPADQIEQYCSSHPDIMAMVVSKDKIIRLGL
jgi:thiamine biosynthesis lipoprotein